MHFEAAQLADFVDDANFVQRPERYLELATQDGHLPLDGADAFEQLIWDPVGRALASAIRLDLIPRHWRLSPRLTAPGAGKGGGEELLVGKPALADLSQRVMDR